MMETGDGSSVQSRRGNMRIEAKAIHAGTDRMPGEMPGRPGSRTGGSAPRVVVK